jgi:5-oxoprolinase (ATP-hydrolysing)
MSKLTICIDRGGTFTDCIGFTGKPGEQNYKEYVVKLLSEDPANYKDAPREGIRRILERALGKTIPRTELVPTDDIGKYLGDSQSIEPRKTFTKLAASLL